jgi:type III secretory pathway component EscU
MRDRLNTLLQVLFHTGLPLFLVVVLMILNALLSQSGALLR